QCHPPISSPSDTAACAHSSGSTGAAGHECSELFDPSENSRLGSDRLAFSQNHRPVSALDVGRHADGPTAWLSAKRGTRTPRVQPGGQSPAPPAAPARKSEMVGDRQPHTETAA